ncbi:DHH family phosphoesterase [Hazenella coriacea]|uniref:Phosphoesterase RecJ-like protein n=1 Tax=Hazenella coriacea TaxID=1179467 RepID=A0A4R3L0J5_9BACL|nr:bifunctional oligoribonuclease/PAP phosphatase NrnA [Hazenella coriacea]TCS92550.1 phosphoesterase RecJ-like protein [Hazenella coriacea]
MNKFADVMRFIQEADEILVVSHVNPDGDAVSSTLAAAEIIRFLGKSITMVNESPVPDKFSFLSGAGDILQPEQLTHDYRFVVALDCGDEGRIGSVREKFTDDVQIVNIDHHISNDYFGMINVVEEAAATAEILFQWIEEVQIPWTHSLATMIYTGLLTDTGGFRYSNTTPQVLRQAAHLVELGIPAYQIADQVLETTTIEHLQLLQTALHTLQRSEDGWVAWMTMYVEDLRKVSTNEDLDGIVNYARNIEGVDVGLLFRETEDNSVKVSLRSRARVDVAKIAKSLGGGGHARAAGCTLLNITVDEAKKLVLSRVHAQLESELS